jgi:hypothetical protein
MRVLLGLLGAIALGAGVVVGMLELRALGRSAPVMPAVLYATVGGLAALGGMLLLRGAFRGRITVRRPGHRPPLV